MKRWLMFLLIVMLSLFVGIPAVSAEELKTIRIDVRGPLEASYDNAVNVWIFCDGYFIVDPVQVDTTTGDTSHGMLQYCISDEPVYYASVAELRITKIPTVAPGEEYRFTQTQTYVMLEVPARETAIALVEYDHAATVAYVVHPMVDKTILPLSQVDHVRFISHADIPAEAKLVNVYAYSGEMSFDLPLEGETQILCVSFCSVFWLKDWGQDNGLWSGWVAEWVVSEGDPWNIIRLPENIAYGRVNLTRCDTIKVMEDVLNNGNYLGMWWYARKQHGTGTFGFSGGNEDLNILREARAC